LLAAVQPEQHKYLFFVSRGNGTSEFAENLSGHNRNVSRYILGQGQTTRPTAVPAPAPAGAPSAPNAPAAAPADAGPAAGASPETDSETAQGQDQ
jgi:UPF0755 protein